jgi:hypothetical protein
MPTEKKQKKSPIFVLLTVIVLIFVIGIGMNLMKTPLSSPIHTLPACQYDPDVCQFFEVLQKKDSPYTKSLTITIQTTQNNQTQSKIIIASDKQGNLSLASSKNNAIQGESVLFDNTQYIKDLKSNTWAVSPTPPDSTLRDFKEKTISEINRTGENASYVFIRGVSCGNLTCMKYQRVLSKNDPVKTFLFFDTTSHLLREVTTTTANGTTTDTTFSYDPVTLTRPSI